MISKTHSVAVIRAPAVTQTQCPSHQPIRSVKRWLQLGFDFDETGVPLLVKGH